jgi:hypothetical protein
VLLRFPVITVQKAAQTTQVDGIHVSLLASCCTNLSDI